MKLHFNLSLRLASLLLATACLALGQNSSTNPETPPTFPEHGQTAPQAMPPDQSAPSSEAQGEQNQNAGETEMSALGPKVQQAIASDSMLENSDVKVQVQGDQLVLTGTVSSQNAKERAEQIAAPYATKNNLQLVNHISVQS